MSVVAGSSCLQPAGDPGIRSRWGSSLCRRCLTLPVSRLTVPRCSLPAAARELLSASQRGPDLPGPPAASAVPAGDHPSTGACGHAQQHAGDSCRLCGARPGHQPQRQSDSDAAPHQPDGRPQLRAPALVQAAECRQRGGPQVGLRAVASSLSR